MSSTLVPGELFKYEWRVALFLKKYRDGSAFTTVDRRTVHLAFQQHIETLIKERNLTVLGRTPLVTDTGHMVFLRDLQKTAEFGGRGAGVGAPVATGERVHGLLHRQHSLDPSYRLHVPAVTERGELMVMQDINEYIMNMGGPINISVNGQVLKNVYGANKVFGTPKADISLVSYDTTRKRFQDVFYLSHKLGNSAGEFQQYSGVTKQADGKNMGSISQHPEVLEFQRKLVNVHTRIVQNRERFYMELEDTTLVGRSVYGPLFGQSEHGVDNIDMIAQGNPVFRPQGKLHVLTFSAAASSVSPDISHFRTGSYRAVLAARYAAERGFTVEGTTYNNVRVLIMPIGSLGGQAKNIDEVS